jgi:tRNA (guanine-N7-)-methyltransferase
MRIRQHVNPLKSDLLDIADVPRVEVEPGRALEVELGAAEAHFLIDRARDDRTTEFVGVEIRRDLVDAVNAAIAAGGPGGPTNVRSVFANMSVDMARLFHDGSVRRFFLNFPDPFFKRRQHKRRVIGPGLTAAIGRALVPGGELFVQTDIFALALDAMAAMEAEPGFTNTAGSWTFLRESPYTAKSRRERQCETEGVRIWRLLYVKTPLPNPLPASRGEGT